MSDEQTQRLQEYIAETLPNDWVAWPGGWPGEIEAALLDAVFSIQARYGGPSTGVRSVVKRWRSHRQEASLDDLDALVAYSSRGDELVSILENHQQVPGRSATKAQAVASAASNLTALGIRHAADVDPARLDLRDAYRKVPGLGEVTWEYFLMLLGVPGVKADTMIQRFVTAALGPAIPAADCATLVKAVADRLDVSPTVLDHAIWSYQRDQQ